MKKNTNCDGLCRACYGGETEHTCKPTTPQTEREQAVELAKQYAAGGDKYNPYSATMAVIARALLAEVEAREKAEKDMAEYCRRYDKQVVQLTEARAEIDRITGEWIKSKDEANVFRAKLAAKDQEISSLSDDRDAWRDRADAHLTEINALRSSLAAQSLECDAMREALTDLSSHYLECGLHHVALCCIDEAGIKERADAALSTPGQGRGAKAIEALKAHVRRCDGVLCFGCSHGAAREALAALGVGVGNESR